jgi:preprotein translocase SecF subunit
MVDFVKRRRLYYLISTVLILIGIAAMVISTQTYRERSIIRLSIDFIGGALFQLQFEPVAGQTPGTLTGTAIQQAFTAAGLSDVTAQRVGIGETYRWQVRANFGDDSAEQIEAIAQNLTALANSLNLTFDAQHFRENFSEVSPVIGSEVTNAALVATAVASALVLFWIALAFRKLQHSFRYGMTALIAMVHDVLIMLGAMSIMGLIAGWEADALFVTALLTVIGYSVQDTIVVFDRIRENDVRHRGEPYELIVNRSLLEIIQRSLMTQIAVGFVLVALLILTSGSIQQFVGILLVGLLSGSYSSIFIAVPLLVSWENGEIPFVNRAAKRRAATA